MNEEKKCEEKIIHWRFWLFFTLSASLVIIFGFYLPLNFQNQGMSHGGHMAVSHEEHKVTSGIAVDLNTMPLSLMVGSFARLDFFVNTKPENAPVPFSALHYEHEKLMHVIGVRDDMNEFFHIHPEPSSETGVLETWYMFKNPGRYKMWSEISYNGENHAFGHSEFNVEGEGERYHKEVSFLKSVTVDGYKTFLYDSEPIVKGENTELAFDVYDGGGIQVSMEPFLGTDMHLTVIKDDWKQFIHTHPDAGVHVHSYMPSLIKEVYADGVHPMEASSLNAPPKSIHFHVIFPEAGLYRMYAQFRPMGIGTPKEEPLTASFWVRVDDTGPIRISQISLVMISLVLMTLLSWGIKKFLEAKV